MSKLISLVKYSLINTYSLNKSKKGQSFKSMVIQYGGIGLLFMLLAFVSLNVVYIQLETFSLPPSMYLFLIFNAMFMLILSTDAVKSPGSIFNVKDFDLLATLPISQSSIILSKIIDILLNSYMFMIIIGVPAYIVYFINNPFDITLLLLLIISSLFLPLIPMSLGILIGYIVYRVASKFKFKEMAISVVYMVFIALFLGIMYSLETSLNFILEKIPYFLDIMTKIYLPIKFYMVMITENSVLNLLYFALASSGVFIILMLIIKNKFVAINSEFKVFGKSSDKEYKTGKRQSKILSLYKVEFLKYISKGPVVINTAVSGIIYVLLICLENFGVLNMGGDSMAFTMGASLFLISPLTAVLISLEGKAFSIKKSLPVSPKEIILSKLLFGVSIYIPFALIGGLINFLLGGATFLEAIIQTIIVILAIFAGGTFGLLVDLKNYNFSWNTEVEVVKKGKSVIITLIPGMFIMFILMFSQIGGINSIILAGVLFGGMFLISGLLLFFKGEKLYNEIE